MQFKLSGVCMKNLFILVIACVSLNLFAGPVEETVREIEREKQARCAEVSRSVFSKCFGIPETCFYSVKFNCLSNVGDFFLKVKVRQSQMGTVVRGTVIKKK